MSDAYDKLVEDAMSALSYQVSEHRWQAGRDRAQVYATLAVADRLNELCKILIGPDRRATVITR